MRSNRAIAISGCLLHQSLMATGCEAAPAMIRPVIAWACEHEIGLVPWTCPETMFAGLPRKTKGIEGYRKAGFGRVADDIAAPFADYLQTQIAAGVEILAVVGVSFSPACSARRQAYHANEKGLFIQALVAALAERDLSLPVIDIERGKPDSITAALDGLINAKLM